MKKRNVGTTIVIVCSVLAIVAGIGITTKAKNKIRLGLKLEDTIENGVKKLKEDKYDEAIDSFKSALEIDNENKKASKLLELVEKHQGIIKLYEANNYEEAVEVIPLMSKNIYSRYLTQAMKDFYTEVAIKYNKSQGLYSNWYDPAAVEEEEQANDIQEEYIEEYIYVEESSERIYEAEALILNAGVIDNNTTVSYMGIKNIEGKECYYFDLYNPNAQNSKDALVEVGTENIYLYNVDHGVMTQVY